MERNLNRHSFCSEISGTIPFQIITYNKKLNKVNQVLISNLKAYGNEIKR